MIEMNDTLKILKFIINFMDPKVKNFFEELEKNYDINSNINNKNNKNK